MKIQFPEGNTTIDQLDVFDVFRNGDEYYIKLYNGAVSLRDGKIIGFSGSISVTKYPSTLIIGKQ